MKRLIAAVALAVLLLAGLAGFAGLQTFGPGRLYADSGHGEPGRLAEFVQTLDWWDEGEPLTVEYTASYGQIDCVVVREGEPIMGADHLLAFFPNGRALELASAWQIDEVQIADGRCYFLSMLMGFGDRFKIYAVDFQTQTVLPLGEKDFIYNRPIVDLEGALYIVGGRDDPFPAWHIEEDGLYALGFCGRALADDVVADVELAAATYGVWRLDKNGDGQELAEKLELPLREQ